MNESIDFHMFNVEVAKKYGVNEAILIRNFQFWMNGNYANGKNIFDGHVWTYNTRAALSYLFPYLTERAVRYAIDNLVNQGVLMKGCYNKSRYDRTTWYAFVNEELWLSSYQCKIENTTIPLAVLDRSHWTKTANEADVLGQTIPDSKPDSKPDGKHIYCDKRQKSGFVIPTIEEISLHIKEKNYTIDPIHFHSYYESNGWMIGKTKMKNWKAAIITWVKNNDKYKTNNNSQQQAGKFVPTREMWESMDF